jgi:hypothetical protein
MTEVNGNGKTKKYVMETTTKTIGNVTLHRIWNVKKGALGGWIETEKNLSQDGDAWVSGEAQVFGEAQVSGSARLSKAWVYREVAPGVCVLLPPEARP